MSRHRQPEVSPSVHESGAALIVTLLVLTLLVVVVTGFLSTTRVEQMAARNYTYQSAAEQMAQLATKQAINALRTNYQTATSSIVFATQPGAITVLQGGGSVATARTLPLYSSNATSTNLNSLATNGWITGNAAQAVNVGLINVSNNAGGLVGRYGFFIDDESAKLPLNAAVRSRNTLNPVFPRPYGVEGIAGFSAGSASSFGNVVAGGSVGASSMSNWSYFFTPEQAVRLFGLGSANLPLVSAAYETNAAYSTNTPWGSPKVYINSLPFSDVGVSQIVSALTNSNLTRLFGQNFANKYGSANIRQLAANILQMRDINVFNAAPTNFWRTNVLLGGVGLPSGAPVASPPTAGAGKKTNGIPLDYLGHAPFPMLEEISVSVAYGWVSPPPNPRMMVKIVLDCTLFNPFPVEFPGNTGLVSAQVDKARFQLTYPGGFTSWRGPDGTAMALTPHNDMPSWNPSFTNVWDPWGGGDPNGLDGGVARVLNPASGIRTAAIPPVPARGRANVSLEFSVTFNEANGAARINWPQFYCIIDNVRLLADSNDNQSVRDWCSGNDFLNGLAGSAAGPAQFRISYVGPTPQPTGVDPMNNITGGSEPAPPTLPPSTKFVKLDPRMRPPLAVSSAFSSIAPGRAWTNIAYGSSAPNGSAFTNASIPADLSFTTNAVAALHDTNMPPYLNVSGLAVPTYHSAADLGKVFTGVPWRRLRLQPQPPQETNSTGAMIPDWVVLDIFDVSTPGTAVTPVNPNSTIASQSASIARSSAGLLSQMGALTSAANIPQLGNPTLTNGAPVTQLTYASLVVTNSSRLQTISSNAASPGTTASWSAGWRAGRAALGFPADVLLLPSEITEIAGVSDYIVPTNNASKANEQRLAALFPGIQTKSRFFTIYALGEAFEGTNANAPVASQRILKTMVRVNTNSSPPGVDIIYQVAPQN